MLEAFVLAVVPQGEAGLGTRPTVSGLERLGSRLVRHASFAGALGPSLSLRPPSTVLSSAPSAGPSLRRPPATLSVEACAERAAEGAPHASPFYNSQPEGGLDRVPTLPHRQGKSLDDAILPLAPSGMNDHGVIHQVAG